MTRPPPGNPESEQLATRDEKVSGWRALTKTQKVKLAVFADQQARMRQRYSPGLTGEDLISAALERAFMGKRQWRLHKISFLEFMFGIVRSIAGDLKRTAEGKLIAASSSDQELGPAGDEGGERKADEIAIDLDTPENILIAKQQLAAFMTEFEGKDDEEAWCILECMSEGMTGPEIKEKLGITQTQYESACKKIARRAHKYFVAN